MLSLMHPRRGEQGERLMYDNLAAMWPNFAAWGPRGWSSPARWRTERLLAIARPPGAEPIVCLVGSPRSRRCSSGSAAGTSGCCKSGCWPTRCGWPRRCLRRGPRTSRSRTVADARLQRWHVRYCHGPGGCEQLIPLTVPEVRRLLYRLVWKPNPSEDLVLGWSRWRRRRQAGVGAVIANAVKLPNPRLRL